MHSSRLLRVPFFMQMNSLECSEGRNGIAFFAGEPMVLLAVSQLRTEDNFIFKLSVPESSRIFADEPVSLER